MTKRRGRVKLIALTLASLPMVVHADSIPIVNPGFEDTSGQTTLNEFTFGDPVGWTRHDPNNISAGGGSGVFFGTLQPNGTDFFNSTAPEGSRVGLLFANNQLGLGEYGYTQTLTAVLDTRYELSVAVGNIGSGTAVSGQFFNLDEFPGYRIELLAGGQVLVEDNNSLGSVIPEREFRTATLSISVGHTHPLLGQALGIRLVNLNEIPAGFDANTSPDLEVDFDAVQLVSSPMCLDDLVLANDVISGTQVFLRNSVTLGPNLVVDGTSVEIQAVATVTFLNDTEIGSSFAAGTGFSCPAGPGPPPVSPPVATQARDTSGDIAIQLDGLRAGGRLITGESVTVQATASGQPDAVDFLANGALLATDTSPPFELLFTAPAGVGSVTFSVVVHDGVGNAVTSPPVIVPIDADLLATVKGRVVDAQGLPVAGAAVAILSEGLLAEYFDFEAPLEEIPDQAGLTPDRVTRVTALNLRRGLSG